MSLINWKKENGGLPVIGTFLDDFWDRDFFKGFATGTTLPAVNVKEADKYFAIEVAAPGLEKEDFQVEVDHGMLTISAERKEESEEKNGEEVTRREFNFTSFRRSMTLPENVKEDGVTAKYESGVLKLHLPKVAATAAKPRKTIPIK